MHIHELHLWTNDLDRQGEFYSRVLELPLNTADDRHFGVQIGSTALTFAASVEAAPATYHFAFNIPEHQFVMAKQWLAARVPLLTEPGGADEFHFRAWNAHAVYFADAAGNVGELIARHDLSQGADRPFTGASLLNVSEVGLAVEDVLDFVSVLQENLKAPVYRDELGDTFTALGDAQGLLIVVKLGRLWFPDLQVAAVNAPLTIRVSDGTGRHYRVEGPPYRVTTF